MDLRTLIGVLTACVLTTAVEAGDVHQGKILVDKHCQECHQSEVYTRSDRLVKTLPGLYKQVRRCEQALDLTWFDEDIDNTSTYLNQEFYKFDR